MHKMKTVMVLAALVALIILVGSDIAWASDAGDGSLPWETPLKTLSKSIKGPVAYAISLMGIVAAGAMLIWGGEINEFVRRIIMLILVISVIIFASNVLTALFVGAAVI